jgi:mannose-6-phosphate isomerase-like protein (cupin superfamily)
MIANKAANKAPRNVLSGNIEEMTLNNKNYRKVINTTRHQQLVLMSLKPKEEIGMEIHKKVDQFIRIEKGSAIAIIGKDEQKIYKLKKEYFITIPAGTYHNIINIGKGELKLYSIYSPYNHKKGTVQKVKPKNDYIY